MNDSMSRATIKQVTRSMPTRAPLSLTRRMSILKHAWHCSRVNLRTDFPTKPVRHCPRMYTLKRTSQAPWALHLVHSGVHTPKTLRHQDQHQVRSTLAAIGRVLVRRMRKTLKCLLSPLTLMTSGIVCRLSRNRRCRDSQVHLAKSCLVSRNSLSDQRLLPIADCRRRRKAHLRL